MWEIFRYLNERARERQTERLLKKENLKKNIDYENSPTTLDLDLDGTAEIDVGSESQDEEESSGVEEVAWRRQWLGGSSGVEAVTWR